MDNRKKKFIRELCARGRARRESGLFVVDGPKMCSEVPLEIVKEVYVTKDFLASAYYPVCSGLLQKNRYEVVSASDMEKMSDTVTPQGILVVAEQKKAVTLESMTDTAGPALLLILETIQDPGNLGTMFRAAEAAGATGIIMNAETVDPYSPKVVRSTMGSIFRVPFLITEDLGRTVTLLKSPKGSAQPPVQVIATDLTAVKSYRDVDYSMPTAVMIGNESKGLSQTMKELANEKVIIPMKGKVESLNAAMSATIMLFEASGERR